MRRIHHFRYDYYAAGAAGGPAPLRRVLFGARLRSPGSRRGASGSPGPPGPARQTVGGGVVYCSDPQLVK